MLLSVAIWVLGVTNGWVVPSGSEGSCVKIEADPTGMVGVASSITRGSRSASVNAGRL
jgi:hypothetical protein